VKTKAHGRRQRVIRERERGEDGRREVWGTGLMPGDNSSW